MVNTAYLARGALAIVQGTSILVLIIDVLLTIVQVHTVEKAGAETTQPKQFVIVPTAIKD